MIFYKNFQLQLLQGFWLKIQIKFQFLRALNFRKINNFNF